MTITHKSWQLRTMKTTHGGIRTGAGRKRKEKREVAQELKQVSLHARIPNYLKCFLKNSEETQSKLIENAIIKTYRIKRVDTAPLDSIA